MNTGFKKYVILPEKARRPFRGGAYFEEFEETMKKYIAVFCIIHLAMELAVSCILLFALNILLVSNSVLLFLFFTNLFLVGIHIAWLCRYLWKKRRKIVLIPFFLILSVVIFLHFDMLRYKTYTAMAKVEKIEENQATFSVELDPTPLTLSVDLSYSKLLDLDTVYRIKYQSKDDMHGYLTAIEPVPTL